MKIDVPKSGIGLFHDEALTNTYSLYKKYSSKF